MKITLVRSMARSAVFELVNSGCYRAPAPYTVSLDGATVCEGDTNVFSLYSLEPGRSYTLAVTLDGVTDTLDFTTAEESFFVDASRSIILSRYSRLKFITIRLEAVSPSEAVLWIWFSPISTTHPALTI